MARNRSGAPAPQTDAAIGFETPSEKTLPFVKHLATIAEHGQFDRLHDGPAVFALDQNGILIVEPVGPEPAEVDLSSGGAARPIERATNVPDFGVVSEVLNRVAITRRLFQKWKYCWASKSYWLNAPRLLRLPATTWNCE